MTGEKPDDASLLRMRRVSVALNLRDNDALWSMLAVLEYYARLYEAMPERVRQAGKGNLDAVREEAREATDALMAQHRDALARCKATIELAERMTERPGLPVSIIVNRDIVLRPYQPLFFNRGALQ